MVTDLDRFSRAIRAIVREVFSDLDYLALYPATIATVNDDKSLDVKPLDPRMPKDGLRKVPLRTFLPGVEVTCKTNGRVLIGFEAGDSTKPYAQLFDGGALDSLKITASGDVDLRAKNVTLHADGLPSARQGDMTASGGSTPTPCIVTLTAPVPVTTPAGQGSIAPGTPIAGGITFQPALYGIITSGRPSVKA